jgi:hypothetical protein
MGGRRTQGPDCLLVCTGRDCKGSKQFEALMEMANGLPHAAALPCQGLCHGPIAGVRVGARVHWYEKVRTGKVRKQLAGALRAGERPKGLRDLEVGSRRDVIKGARRARSIGRKSVDLAA